MTFVELVERYRRECGVSGSPITSVANLTGEHQRLRDWIASAWNDIQMLNHGMWAWMRSSSSHTIPQYGSLLMPAEHLAGTVNYWLVDTFRVAALGEPISRSVPIDPIPYDDFMRTAGLDVTQWAKPSTFTVRLSDKALIVAPGADQAYTLFFDYQAEPTVLEDDTDTPEMPAKLHMLIVYEAMLSYGHFEAAAEVLNRAREKRAELLFALEGSQLPPPTWGGPLA